MLLYPPQTVAGTSTLWVGGPDAEVPDESSFKTVALKNHVGTHTLRPLRYENVITTHSDNCWAVQCPPADKFDAITEHDHRRDVNRKRTTTLSPRHTHRRRPRNHGAHPVTFLSVTRACIDPHAYVAAQQ